MESQLRSRSFEALAQCEQLFDALGMRMTAGAELEWYSLLDVDQSNALLPAQVEEEVKKIPPEILADSHAFRTKEAGGIDTSLFSSIHHLLLFRVEQRLQAEQIPFFSASTENGTLGGENAATILEPDGRRWRARGQKLEVSLGISGLTQQAHLLEKLHTIIEEESAKMGLMADFRSKPPYTYINMENNTWRSPPLPGTSQHVHYGLLHKDTGGNALLTQDGQVNHIAAAHNDHMRDLLQRGGQFLANPLEDDYARFQHINHRTAGVPLYLGHARQPLMARGKLKIRTGETLEQSIEKAVFCLREIDMEAEKKQNYHKELRIMGGYTPAPAALLLPAIAMADTLLTSVGRSTGFGNYRHASHVSHLEVNIPGIGEVDRDRLQRAIQQPQAVSEMNLEKLKTSWADAAHTLRLDSPLFHYAPHVFELLQKSDGKALCA